MPDADSFNPILLLPTYNNASKLGAVLDAAAGLGLPLLVVNDGSTDDTSKLLDEFAASSPGVAVTLLDHARNRGKGDAMRTGFTRALELGHTHALTMDTDGQHDPADAAALLAAAAAQPTALVTGHRDVNDPAYPQASRLGRTFSNLAILLASGRRVEDSQCGYRVYPLGLTRAVKCRAGRYGYEAEILTRSGWADCPLVQVPVRVIYPEPDQRISHFRPLRDTLHGLRLHTRLLLRAVLPIPFVKWPPPEVSPPAPEAEQAAVPRVPWWKRILRWFDPRELLRAARRDRVSQMSVAAGLGVGAFVANLPVYPLQSLVAVYFAKRLHVHPVSTVAGSQLSFPPVGLLLVFAAITLGHLVLTGTPASWADFSNLGSLSLGEVHVLMRTYFFAWWIGGVTLGVVLGFATFILAMLALRLMPVEHDSVIEESEEGDKPGAAHQPGLSTGVASSSTAG